MLSEWSCAISSTINCLFIQIFMQLNKEVIKCFETSFPFVQDSTVTSMLYILCSVVGEDLMKYIIS